MSSPIRIYTDREYEIPFCGGIAIITLFVEVHPRETWNHPLQYASGQDLVERGDSGILMRDIVTHENFYCSFGTLAQAFPDVNISECGFSGASGIIAKDGHPFDPQQFYAWKKQENLLMPGA